jgi:hypothetical protein
VDGSPERINHFVHIYVDPYKINGTYPIPEEYWIEPDAMKGFSPIVVVNILFNLLSHWVIASFLNYLLYFSMKINVHRYQQLYFGRPIN